MKRFALVCLCMMVCSTVFARDYVKLQAKEMGHAQKYSTTKIYFDSKETSENVEAKTNIVVKDPHIMRVAEYKKIDPKKYEEKIKADNKEYDKMEKVFKKRGNISYNSKAKGDDYYKIYRITEKLIRANNLDYINWRIGVSRSTEVNAYSTDTNYININTGTIDNFLDNDDALAMIIGHEISHNLLGHQIRSNPTIYHAKVIDSYLGGAYPILVSSILKRKYLIDSKNEEFAADVEGAKLALRAGYNLNDGSEIFSYYNTLFQTWDYWQDHPATKKRIENLRQNRAYFWDEDMIEEGKANIYNSEVLSVKISSDRASITICGNPNRIKRHEFYKPETPAQVYARSAYKAYTNGNFHKSAEYFDEMFKLDTTNAPAYLYASYANEYLYKNTGDKRALEKAKLYAKTALNLDPQNKYMKEQVEAL